MTIMQMMMMMVVVVVVITARYLYKDSRESDITSWLKLLPAFETHRRLSDR